MEEEEEEVFITSGNWGGKHNSLSRGSLGRSWAEGEVRCFIDAIFGHSLGAGVVRCFIGSFRV